MAGVFLSPPLALLLGPAWPLLAWAACTLVWLLLNFAEGSLRRGPLMMGAVLCAVPSSAVAAVGKQAAEVGGCAAACGAVIG